MFSRYHSHCFFDHSIYESTIPDCMILTQLLDWVA
jgi:hypothetical protein